MTSGNQSPFSEIISPCTPMGLMAYQVGKAPDRRTLAERNVMPRPGLRMRISYYRPGKSSYRMAIHPGPIDIACKCTKISLRNPEDIFAEGAAS